MIVLDQPGAAAAAGELGAPDVPVELDLGSDVVVLALPVCPAGEFAASDAAFKVLLAKGGDAALSLEATIATAREAVVGWRGVQFPDGAEVPFAPDRLEQLFRTRAGYAITFATKYLQLRRKWDAEKNSSAGSRPGITTAKPARNSANVVKTGAGRARSAHPGPASTGRAARRARKPVPSGAS